ncbi:hypothetical protein BDY19DRAFT_925032 [Irpex rosettiformis]|uniref:Uncharacterized protein n=1 Tax=Irpex rosettiformis TaxID=378272 RepID=A0ACB8UE98_9APHY|nr:hypothetical protein BDY19DRAFT_925032 [Irpex rosettiformis]
MLLRLLLELLYSRSLWSIRYLGRDGLGRGGSLRNVRLLVDTRLRLIRIICGLRWRWRWLGNRVYRLEVLRRSLLLLLLLPLLLTSVAIVCVQCRLFRRWWSWWCYGLTWLLYRPLRVVAWRRSMLSLSSSRRGPIRGVIWLRWLRRWRTWRKRRLRRVC